MVNLTSIPTELEIRHAKIMGWVYDFRHPMFQYMGRQFRKGNFVIRPSVVRTGEWMVIRLISALGNLELFEAYEAKLSNAIDNYS